MNNKKRKWSTRSALTILGIVLISGCFQGLKRGEVSPDFVLESTTGGTVGLYDSPGAVKLVCFWAVGCPPCRDEAPHLQHLHERYGDRGLRVLAVNAWDESPAMVRGFLDEHNIRYTVLLNGADVHQNQYEGRGVPSTYLIDRDRKIQYVCHGWSSTAGHEVESRIKQMLDDSRQ